MAGDENMNCKIVNIKDHPELIESVIGLGDSQRQTLGFLPAQAFLEYAERGSILVAVSDQLEVIGYALFAHKQNRVCRLAHVCVDPKWRKSRVGNLLVSSLKKEASQMDRIIVKCRRDYGIDSFWEKNGFIARGEVSGRGLGDTTLTSWEYRFRPSLLSLPAEKSKQMAVLDLNVVIDVSLNGENECKALLTFTYADEIDFRVSMHSFLEANRNNDKNSRDITRGQLNALQQVGPCQDASIVGSVLDIIGSENNDDAEQIASAIYNDAEFFITLDAKLTNHFEDIQKKFGLSVYTPTEFIVNYCNGSGRDLYFPGYLNSSNIVFKPMDGFKISELFQRYKGVDEKKHSFEENMRIVAPDIKGHSIFKIFLNDDEVGVCVQNKIGYDLAIRALRLGRSVKHLHTISVHVVESILCNAISLGVKGVCVDDKSAGRFVEQALVSAGFQHTNSGYIRSIGTGFLSLHEALGKIGIQGEVASEADIDLVEIENSLWPAKLTSLNIPIYIVPIRPRWAKCLISSRGHQLSLMGASNVMLQTRRVYYRSCRGVNIQSPGRIVWYVTGDDKHCLCKSCIGVSRIDSVETGPAKMLFKKYERFGVYGWRDIMVAAKQNHDHHLMALVFSKTEIFVRALGFHLLSKIVKNAEGKSFNPVSPFKISQESFVEIYSHGISCGN
ncbi:hypothetical protein JCM15519_22830 [Fundidesulfovibrio butyratiphilus]